MSTSSPQWTPERVVTTELAQALIEAQFPDLAPVRVSLLGTGWDNTAFVINERWVFRFPRRTIAAPLLTHELNILQAVAPTLSLPVPVPERIGTPTEDFPWLFAGYRMLEGRTACRANLDEAQRSAAAAPLGRFLKELHAFPVAEAKALGAPDDEIGRMDVIKRVSVTLPRLQTLEEAGLLTPQSRRNLVSFLEEQTVPTDPRPRALCHGDLYVRHLLVDDAGRPAGVIDWGDLHVGDPAVDLAIAFSFLPPGARDAFWDAYGTPDGTTRRLARLRALAHTVNLQGYAHDVEDQDLLRETQFALSWIEAG